MKKLILICTAFAFALLNVPAGVYAQTIDSYVILEGEQAEKGKELQEAYAVEKEDLELQLRKLIQDREVAKADKNTPLIEKRTEEIAMTRQQLKELPKKYGQQMNEMLTPEQKETLEVQTVDPDFYAKELALEQAKMLALERGESIPAPVKKAPPKKAAPKKKAPAKK